MANSDKWRENDEKFRKFEESIEIPNGKLEDVPNILLKSEEDFNKIPKKKADATGLLQMNQLFINFIKTDYLIKLKIKR